MYSMFNEATQAAFAPSPPRKVAGEQSSRLAKQISLSIYTIKAHFCDTHEQGTPYLICCSLSLGLGLGLWLWRLGLGLCLRLQGNFSLAALWML